MSQEDWGTTLHAKKHQPQRLLLIDKNQIGKKMVQKSIQTKNMYPP